MPVIHENVGLTQTQQTFAQQGLVVVQGVQTPENAQGVLGLINDRSYFSGERPVADLVRITNSRLHVRRQALGGTALGNLLDKLKDIGQEVQVDFESEEFCSVAPWCNEATIQRIPLEAQRRAKESRVQAYGLQKGTLLSIAGHAENSAERSIKSVHAIATIEGKINLWLASGEAAGSVATGSVAIVDNQRYLIEPAAGKTATSLVIAGEILPDEKHEEDQPAETT